MDDNLIFKWSKIQSRTSFLDCHLYMAQVALSKSQKLHSIDSGSILLQVLTSIITGNGWNAITK